MKKYFAAFQIASFFGMSIALGQGTFLCDQQSADEAGIIEGGARIQSNAPFGQSFTPTLYSIGFVRLFLYDAAFGNTSSGTLSINLRGDSIAGTLLGFTEPVVIPAHFAGFADFFFSTPVPVDPGSVYYLEPLVQSGNTWGVNQAGYNYPGGTLFAHGVPDPSNGDMWFREGIVVPEPSSASLALVGAAALALGYSGRLKATSARSEL
jgi:hypothetical protein